ncbi:MAG: hypothetical protein SFV81_12025 [Pirellulaceae bacterium]|nr:hypothetical protein [Pirellulaceae bacterium]
MKPHNVRHFYKIEVATLTIAMHDDKANGTRFVSRSYNYDIRNLKRFLLPIRRSMGMESSLRKKSGPSRSLFTAAASHPADFKDLQTVGIARTVSDSGLKTNGPKEG